MVGSRGGHEGLVCFIARLAFDRNRTRCRSRRGRSFCRFGSGYKIWSFIRGIALVIVSRLYNIREESAASSYKDVRVKYGHIKI